MSRGSIIEGGSSHVCPQNIATTTKACLSVHNFNLILTWLGHAHPTLRMSAVNFRHVINMSSYFAVLNDNRAVLLIQAYKVVLRTPWGSAVVEWTQLTVLLRQELCTQPKEDRYRAAVNYSLYVLSNLWSLVVTLCSTRLHNQKFHILLHNALLFVFCFKLNTNSRFSLHKIAWLIFVIATALVFCEV
jgi:hypothetical protein